MGRKVIGYNEMLAKTKEFYKKLDIEIREDMEDLAVQSLTMPQYKKEYNDINQKKIYDNNSLATVGDAVCSAWLMIKRFAKEKTKEDMNRYKDWLTNANLNKVGENLLKDVLFEKNNDLDSSPNNKEPKKAYATAFEAVVGFIAKTDLRKVDTLLNKYLIPQQD